MSLLRNIWSTLKTFMPSVQVIAPANTDLVLKTSILPISELIRQIPAGDNLEFAGPTHECVCGCDLFVTLAFFEDNQLAGYFTNVLCANCGANLIAPTLADQAVDGEPR